MKSILSKLFGAGWFPLVFAAAFPVTVYSHNQAAFASGEVWRPVIAFVLLGLVLVLALRRILGKGGLAEIATAVLLVQLWIIGFGLPLLAVVIVVAFGCFYFRKTKAIAPLFPVFNALALGVLVLPLLSIYEVQRATAHEARASISYSPFTSLTDNKIVGDRPDIYHIVLDAYAGEQALRDVLNFDNSTFFEALTKLGFQVNRSVRVPYNETVHTMSAVFLGDYLRPGEYPVDSDVPTELRSTLGALIPDSPVHALLRNNGYTILHTETGHDFLRYPRDAKLIRSNEEGFRLTRYEVFLVSLLRLRPYFPDLFRVDEQGPLIRAVKTAFEIDYRKYASPKFVYQHMLAPHTPFTIDRTGATTTAFPGFTNTTEGDRVVRNDPVRQDLYVAGYLEKLRFVNDRLLAQLEQIIGSRGKKVIFVHGDHGSGSRYWMDRPELTCIKERFVSFIAVYADDPELAAGFDWVADEDATPINLYRSLMNDFVGTELEPLKARSHFVRYFHPNVIIPFDAKLIAADCS